MGESEERGCTKARLARSRVWRCAIACRRLERKLKKKQRAQPSLTFRYDCRARLRNLFFGLGPKTSFCCFTCGGQYLYSGHQKKGTKSCPSLSRFWAELDHQTRVGILRWCLISLKLREYKLPSDSSAMRAQSGCCGHDLKTRKKYFGQKSRTPSFSPCHGL